jgi:glutaredoxin
MGIGRELGKKLFSRASGKVVEALSRADELGGKVRDRVSEQLAARKAASPVAPVVRPRVPTSPAPKPPSGLGDPGRPAQVFGRKSCPWSGRAVALLESARVDYSYFDLDAYGGEAVLRDLKLETKQDTVPYIYVRGRFIGGYNALDEIQRLGQLDYLTLAEADRVRHPLHGRVEVAARSHDGERFPGA